MLSKTDFLMYLDAPMHLWARAHDQLERQAPTPMEQHLLQQGQQVEALAKEYIETYLLPDDGKGQLLWQPSYDDGRYTIRADALIYDKDAAAYDLYEIKSSTSVQTQHEYDLTFQVLLLESLLDLRHVYIIHINKDYQQGPDFELKSFFVIESLDDQINKRRDSVAAARTDAHAVSRMAFPKPEFACTKPKSCPCPALCHPDLPEHSIYDIPYLGKKAATLREMGITDLKDVPTSFDLNATQMKHLEAVQSGQPMIDHPAIQTSLACLEYPLYFLDYETFNPGIPLFPGYHPYEHIVFQYSLFRIETPGDKPQHFEELVTNRADPAPQIVSHLMDHLGPEGSVIVWNQSFEAHRNQDLARHCPPYADQLLGINHRLFDLMRIFKDGHYVHPDFHGSASLKAVLPVLCPELRYEQLAISSGEQAMLTWCDLHTGKVPPGEKADAENAMKTYCNMDTFGMIAILKKLQDILRSHHENHHSG